MTTEELYRQISKITLDPGDETARPTIEDVLTRGFNAMGWAQPTLAAYEAVYAVAVHCTEASQPPTLAQQLRARDVREKAEAAIRQFCSSLGVGSVTISSDGVERIYHAGISLKALSAAVAVAISDDRSPAPATTGEGADSVAVALKRAHELIDAVEAADPDYSWTLDYGKDLLKDINQTIHRGGTHALAQDCLKRCHREIRRLRNATEAQSPAESSEPKTLWGMIAAVYGELDAEDCAFVDREWAKMRGYIIPEGGTSTLSTAHPAYQETPHKVAQAREKRLAEQSAEIKALEAELSQARDQVEGAAAKGQSDYDHGYGVGYEDGFKAGLAEAGK